ncbi:zinc-binding dehydrogenase domain-containing protein [Sarocladium implicatum]|nr:zinc-binding dehydrogenase domain-containing protein [Sarocladium implicatum]
MANQAWQITAPGQLSLTDLKTPAPQPGPNEVLLRMKAVSLNFRDLLILNHNPKYPAATSPNLVPCCDGAGIVEEAGPGSPWKKGDQVFLHPNSWVAGNDVRSFIASETLGCGTKQGTLRRWSVWRDDQLIAAPSSLSLAETSTVFTAGVTAWNALMHGYIDLKPGMTVVTEGTGGVSSWVIMIAAAAGAKVIATSSSDAKLEVAKQLGATHLVNYRTHPDWEDEVLELTNGEGADIAVEVVAGPNIEHTLKAIRRGGHVIHLGLLSDKANEPVNIMPALWYGSKTIRGLIGTGSKEMAEELVEFIQKHDLHPPIAQTFEFEEAREAMEALKTLSKPGKIVINIE